MNPDRAFLFGLIGGVLVIVAAFVGVSVTFGVRWQPVFIGSTR